MSGRRAAPRVVVIGAGAGGLAAAIALAGARAAVTVLEKEAACGGKMRALPSCAGPIDAGPTVITMRRAFDDLLSAAGLRLDEIVALAPLDLLARHAWTDGSTLDLHADLDRSAEAIAAFAGPAEAAGFRAFAARAAAMLRVLAPSWIAAERPTPLGLAARVGGPRNLLRISPFGTLWRALGDHFRDPRLRQLFGRYATYTGCSPFAAPATLMLVAAVELQGVWRAAGGMRALAEGLVAAAARLGAEIRTQAAVGALMVERGRCVGVQLATGERIAADAVVFNGDVAALADGRLGPAARAAAGPPTARAARSQSALVWTLAGQVDGLDLAHHTVCFGPDYAEEFDAVFRRRTIPAAPTVYLCAQDRDDRARPAPGAPERLLMLVNAPPDGDRRDVAGAEADAAWEAALRVLAGCGVRLTPAEPPIATGPEGFEALFPATGGALYGRVNHGAFAGFARPGAQSALPGLWLAGGSVHPGPGVPMAVLSGRLAAARLLADWEGRPRAVVRLPPPV